MVENVLYTCSRATVLWSNSLTRNGLSQQDLGPLIAPLSLVLVLGTGSDFQ